MAKVLLVEDDNNLREIYEARLQAEGYQIVSANDGEAALVVAKNEKPDLIISDVMMPKISGFEMLDILRNTPDLRDTKVIMLTALGQAEDQTRADKLGADRYLVKSQVTLEDIVRVSHELLGDGAAQPSEAAAPVTPAAPAGPATPQQAAAPAPAEPATAAITVAAAPPPEPPAADAPAIPPAPVAAPQPAAGPAPGANTAQSASSSNGDTSAVDPSSAQSSAAEEAAVTKQIEDFVAATAATPPPAAEVAASPQTVATDNAANDEQVLADAVNNLVTSADPAPDAPSAQNNVASPDPAPEAPAPPAAVTDAAQPDANTNGSVPVAHKKVIQPINDTSKPDLEALLAAEEAKETAAQAAAPPEVVVGGTEEAKDDPPAGAPVSSSDNTGIIAPGSNGPVDPNSIAL